MDTHPDHVAFDPAALAGALFQDTADALFVIDPLTERILDANLAAVSLSGFDRDQLLQLSLRGLIRHEQEWQDWNLGPPSSTPLPGQDSFLLRTSQPDAWLPVSIHFSRLVSATGDPLALCRLRDRRESVDALRRIARVEAELRRLLGSVSEAIYTARIEPDGRWRFRTASPRFARLTGRPAAGPLDPPQARDQAVLPDDLPRWRTLLGAIDAGQPGEAEYRLRRPDGSVIWVRESVAVFPENGGAVLHGILTELPARREEARPPTDLARLEALARLAGIVSHDFNNLLAGILGNVNLARLDGVGLDVLDRIEAVGQRAVEKCKLLATLAGKSQGSPATLDLAALVREQMAARPAVTGVRLKLEISEQPSLISGDAAALRGMLGHLLDNASASLQGKPGEVSVAVRPYAGSVEAGLLLRYPAELPTGPLLCLEVSDSGDGFPPEARAHLFEPYFTTKPGHRGLGLALAAGVARGLGGAIEAFAPARGGTTMRVLLPLASSSVPVPIPVATTPSGRGTVLLLDDEVGVRDVSRRLLATLGYEVLTAASGEEGLELLRLHADEVGLAVVDWHMPGLAGDALLDHVRQIAPTIPIVVISGESDQSLSEREGAKWSAYLQKPFRLPALAELVKRLMGPA